MSKTSKTIQANGNCLCGAVQVTANTINNHFGACHCGMCQKWGGGPLLATECGSDVTFTGEENISVFNSSAWAERGFCKQCGTHLFYRLKESQQYFMPIGLFDIQDELVFDHQIYIDRKSKFYNFANQTENMTEAEVFEKYAV